MCLPPGVPLYICHIAQDHSLDQTKHRGGRKRKTDSPFPSLPSTNPHLLIMLAYGIWCYFAPLCIHLLPGARAGHKSVTILGLRCYQCVPLNSPSVLLLFNYILSVREVTQALLLHLGTEQKLHKAAASLCVRQNWSYVWMETFVAHNGHLKWGYIKLQVAPKISK